MLTKPNLDHEVLSSMDIPSVVTIGLGTTASMIAARSEAAKRDLLGIDSSLSIQAVRAMDVDIMDSIVVLRDKYSKGEMDETKYNTDELRNLFRLSQSEILQLTVPEGRELAERMDVEYAYLKDFVDREVLSLLKGGNQAGARAWRKLGVVIARWNLEDAIRSSIGSAVEQVIDNQSVKRAMNLGFKNVVRYPMKVFLIYSVCGGAGSGATVDISYLLRRMAREKRLEDKMHMVHVILMPGFVQQIDPEESKASSYAVLKELDAMMSKNFVFRARYGNNAQDQVEYTGEIADEVYLFENSSDTTSLRDLSRFTGMVSDFLVAQQLSPMVNVLRSRMSNIETKTQETPYSDEDIYGKLHYVAGGGISRLTFPRNHISQYCRFRAARLTLEQLLNGGERDED